jgi:catechol 2,3-dioxygenase-like lactoylglutathione lyase family enzyme
MRATVHGLEYLMPRVVGIDHLVLSVGDFARSKAFYKKLLGFLGFKLKHEYDDMAGWSNGKTLFWIAAADAQGRKHRYRKAISVSTTTHSRCPAARTWTRSARFSKRVR